MRIKIIKKTNKKNTYGKFTYWIYVYHSIDYYSETYINCNGELDKSIIIRIMKALKYDLHNIYSYISDYFCNNRENYTLIVEDNEELKNIFKAVLK